MTSTVPPPSPRQATRTPGIDDFAHLANAMPQLTWIAEGDGSIFWYNQRWIDYTGRGIDEMRGSGWSAVHHPDHVDRVVANYRRAFGSGDVWEDTFPLRRHDGVYRWFLSRAMPMRDPAGHIVRWFGTNTDVTEQREAEERLRASERRFRTLVDSSADVIWVCDGHGDMHSPQPAWLAYTGQSAARYGGRGWLDAVHPDDRAATAAAWTAAVDSRERFGVEYRLRRRDGIHRLMQVRAVCILDEAGDPREWVGINADITERRAAEDRLEQARDEAEQANRAKSAFIANMSHELRTPLSAVIGYSEMLGEELEDAGQTHLLDDVGKIESSARHLLGLINDVLDLSKIEAGRMTVSVATFASRAMIDDVVTSVGSLVGRNGNQLVLELPDDLGEMRSDEVKVRQCLLNLLSNAAKFTENGTVTFTARRFAKGDVDWMEFSVADTGIGLNDEQIGRLFQRFTQADASTTRQFGGTGLGLAITRAFCRKLGGDVTVTSRPGEGATFAITLPATSEPGQENIGEEDTGQQGVGGDRHDPRAAEQVVLVVDDDPAARDLLTRFLQREGFHVHSAADGRAGISLARSLKPQAVLLDIDMPVMSGWDVLSEIRGDPALAATPVIMISVVNEQTLGYALGATDYLTKPIEWDKLKAVMARFEHAGVAGDVLVIDDDADARGRVRAMLAREGWSVREAGDGRQAIDSVTESAPDLILLDLMMPEMDGFAFLDLLRQRPDGRAIPVVVVTAKDISESERAVLERQADRIILKGSLRLSDLAGELRRLSPTHAG